MPSPVSTEAEGLGVACGGMDEDGTSVGLSTKGLGVVLAAISAGPVVPTSVGAEVALSVFVARGGFDGVPLAACTRV
jgi:hypothetical protein